MDIGWVVTLDLNPFNHPRELKAKYEFILARYEVVAARLGLTPGDKQASLTQHFAHLKDLPTFEQANHNLESQITITGPAETQEGLSTDLR